MTFMPIKFSELEPLPAETPDEKVIIPVAVPDDQKNYKVTPAMLRAGLEPALPEGTDDEYLRGDKTWVNFDDSVANSDAVLDIIAELGGKENAITPGTTAQYWRGDKTWQTLNKAAVGLSNVPNVDATLRSNHTGTQLASTISDFDAAVDAAVATSLAGKVSKSGDSMSGDLSMLSGSRTLYKGPRDYSVNAATIAGDDRLVFRPLVSNTGRYWFDSLGENNTGFSIAEDGSELAYIGSDANDMMFETKGSYGFKVRTMGGEERFRINADGDSQFFGAVQMGANELRFTNDSVPARVFNDGNLHVDSGGANMWLDLGAANLYVNGTGKVGIGTTSPTRTLEVAGTIGAADIFIANAPSDPLHGTNKQYVDAVIAALVDSSPSTLDTLNELAAALGDDPNFATTITALIGTKANNNAVLHLTGDETAGGIKTFSSSPIVPTPTTSSQAANMGYVDTAVAGVVISAGNGLTKTGNTLSINTAITADLSTSQALQNKTFNNTNIATFRSDRFTLQDATDTTKQAIFGLGSIPTGTTSTYTFPGGSGTLVTLGSAQTFGGVKSFSAAPIMTSTATGIEFYNTANQTPDYERVRVGNWSSNTFYIASESTGTGQLRPIRMSVFGIGTSTGYLQMNTSSTTGLVQSQGTTNTVGGIIHIINGTLGASSGTQYGLQVAPTFSQSSTAGYTALLVNVTESSTGSGTKRLLDLQVGGSSKLNIDNSGLISMTNGANIAFGTSTGTKIGSATTQKIGFWGSTPVVQQAAIADSTATAASVSTQLNLLLATMRTIGMIAP